METENGAICAKAARSYREEHINGLSQKELILMLYDGAIRFSSEAKEAIKVQNLSEATRLITRARSIIIELLRILDMKNGGEVAANLQRLYVYMIGRLIEVLFTREPLLLDNILFILQNLRSAWEQIDFEEARMLEQSLSNNLEKKRTLRSSAPPSTSARLLSVTA